MMTIETMNLSKYYGPVRGIVDINLRVEEGEVYGLIGPNGAGKTTLIRTLLGLIRPTRGGATLFGQPIPWGGGELYRGVGYLPTDVRLYPDMTGKELLDYAASFHQPIDPTWRKALQERLQFDPSRRIRSYSHGNRKKLGIIQALLHRPRLLILDEPTTGLDPLVRLELFSVLQEQNRQGVTILFSTHVLEEVDRLCQRVGFIRQGSLVRVSSVHELPGRHMRILTVKLAGGKPPDKSLAQLGHPRAIEGQPGYYRLAVDAPANHITAQLHQVDLEYFEIVNPSIEELFLEIYRGKGEGVQGNA